MACSSPIVALGADEGQRFFQGFDRCVFFHEQIVGVVARTKKITVRDLHPTPRILPCRPAECFLPRYGQKGSVQQEHPACLQQPAPNRSPSFLVASAPPRRPAGEIPWQFASAPARRTGCREP